MGIVDTWHATINFQIMIEHVKKNLQIFTKIYNMKVRKNPKIYRFLRFFRTRCKVCEPLTGCGIAPGEMLSGKNIARKKYASLSLQERSSRV